ncbi:DUF6585 family protein [Thermomonospora umbrina]|uniref:Uncharacterized protein n=1 Tax=Thermomonospora umbrina TaxID=111806 RepID=A0A3D9SKP3_9ACTN|nr:DUF6585 family protein [Thermomonospora umbrina]REE96458.1 hypothetical protein DFJ69_1895 [Thermomonospora umbrina]
MAFPRQVLDPAERRRLGRPVRGFDARPAYRRAVTWLVLLGPPGLLLVFAALYHLVYGPRWVGVAAVPLAVGYLGGLGWTVRGGALRGRGSAVYLFASGLVRVSREGTTPYRWEELTGVTVTGVQPKPGRPTRWRFAVTAAGGGGFEVGDELPGVRELGDVLVSEITRRVLPAYLAAIEEGRALRFGPFIVSGEGVEKDGRRVPWESVGDAGSGNGLVYVRRRDGSGTLSATAGEVPNAVAFAVLCRRVREAPAGSPRRPAR